MTREDFVAVASRVFAIYVLFGLIQSLPGTAQVLFQDGGMRWAGFYGFVVVMGLLLCALLWFFPLSIARKLLPVMRESQSGESLDSSTGLSLGLTLLGAWFFANALLDASYWLTFFIAVDQVTEVAPAWSRDQTASMISLAAQFALSFWLLLGSSGIRRLIYRFRHGSP